MTEHSHHDGSHGHVEHHHKTHKETVVTNKSLTNILLLVALGMLLFFGGYKLGQQPKSSNQSGFSFQSFGNVINNQQPQSAANLNFGLFWETWNKVEEKFIDREKINAENMFYGAIKGMVASLQDPYTFFLTPEENQDSKDDLGGRFEGIGAQLGMDNNRIVVVAPLKNSPAEQAGVQTGDIIVEVDGQSTEGWTLNEAVSKIRGEQGTKVKLGLFRDGEQIDLEITRNTIKVDSVEISYENTPQGDVAYIKVNQFGDTTNTEWNDAVQDVAQRYRNGTVQGLIVDMRGNPGGYLDSAVYLASEFVEQGKLIVKQESTVEGTTDYVVRRQGQLLDIPLVVMIDEGSASASEIFAGALRDYDRAVLVGRKSFGKGSVQEALDLSGGAGLHVTVAKWLLPEGEWINGKGIEPEVNVENTLEEGNTLTRETDKQLDAAVQEVLKQ